MLSETALNLQLLAFSLFFPPCVIYLYIMLSRTISHDLEYRLKMVTYLKKHLQVKK